MSATRKPRAERGTDFFATPGWCVRALLPHLPAVASVCDPCAGGAAILTELAPSIPSAWGIEIDPAVSVGHRFDVVIRDALGDAPWLAPYGSEDRAQLVVMNPPFLHAQAFVERALAEVAPGGTVAALLRLGFLEGKARAALHEARPADVFVLASRPSFTGKGTDASAYAWFVWGPGRGGRWSILSRPVDEAPASGVEDTTPEDGEATS